MTGLWRDPDNDFATGAIPKKLQKVWKEDFKTYKKSKSKTESAPSKIFKQLCKGLKFKSINDEFSRSGFYSSRSIKNLHKEIEFSTIMQTHYNKQYLKLKISKHYDGKQLIQHINDNKFEHCIYLLNSGRALLFGTVLTNLDVTLPKNVIDVVALYLNPPKHIMERMDEDDEENGYSLLLYSNTQKIQKEHKMDTEWNAFFLNIITKWLSLSEENECDVDGFLQYLLSWFLTEKAQNCSPAIVKLQEFISQIQEELENDY